ncbi:segregation and condensation protein B [Sedimentibacter acidaminivorans]|uniref:Segregation and condensation protein B n=1 Tax=Sedimentibacter acidaminivorans TaxID=913099 RepID=A0ABS4GCI3_9FIRM|nr:SMC-Scp complex subunit ScpB [Sedimentibacter acidaminivorans]MBP1925408.1 segregation and condensation protein B [Sedimentibacter acidaminivorans]
MNNNNLKSIIESLLFAWGEPLNINEISKILNIKTFVLNQTLDDMIIEYTDNPNRGLIIQKFGNSYQITTKKDNFEFIQNLLQTSVNKSLSNAAMETLSIIAYKQPVTKVEIELIRGVKCSNVIKGLVDKNLIKEVGKLDKPGKPTLYATTDEFLKHFGLICLDDLPVLILETDEEKKVT